MEVEASRNDSTWGLSGGWGSTVPRGASSSHYSTDLAAEFRRPQLSFGLAKAGDCLPGLRSLSSVTLAAAGSLADNGTLIRGGSLKSRGTLFGPGSFVMMLQYELAVNSAHLQHQRNTKLVQIVASARNAHFIAEILGPKHSDTRWNGVCRINP